MSGEPLIHGSEAAIANLLRYLADQPYRFITPTPLTHQHVLDRRAQLSCQNATRHVLDLRDVFGWNLPFSRRLLDPLLGELMTQAGALPAAEPDAPDAPCRSQLRVASLGNDLFAHSAFPTVQSDAVFFGPDTYRFARFISQVLERPAPACHGHTPLRVLDVGCGSGAGGVAAVRALGHQAILTLNDINLKALRYAAANVVAAAMTTHWLPGDALTEVTEDYDVIIANPPYLDDAQQRAYRHGGARLGRDLSLRMAAAALAHLAPGGRLLLYTGVAIVDGCDPLLAELEALLKRFDGSWTYREIDPDVFGEELARPVYADVDRIAAVGLVATRRGAP